MNTLLVHVSDFHHREGKFENHAVVANAFFVDLATQLRQYVDHSVFLAFSGDLAQGGDSFNEYIDLAKLFNDRLVESGICKSRRIVVPGNHDISRARVQEQLLVHEAMLCQSLTEDDFNNFVLKQPNVFTTKFANFIQFQQEFADIGLTEEFITGRGFELGNNVGVYCLNTALCSSGGLEKDGQKLIDKCRLRVDTRSLYKWALESKSQWKILVMHHPPHWLHPASEVEFRKICQNHFDLVLYGHEHEQESLHSIANNGSKIECCAPALFSRKDDQLGYSLIAVDKKLGVREIVYRQWTRQHKFVSGTGFSNTDNGRIGFHTNLLQQMETTSGEDHVANFLDARLEQALVSFAGQPSVWVDRLIKGRPQLDADEGNEVALDLDTFIANVQPCLFRAPPQFGLSCLAMYLTAHAWNTRRQYWLYLDAREIKPNAASLTQAVAKELSFVGLSHGEIRCVIVDSLSHTERDGWKLINKISERFPGIPILGMESLEPSPVPRAHFDEIKLPFEFGVYYLWAMTRSHVRKIVCAYNDCREIGEENAVITRIVSDLEVLNLHRTPLNCLTLLKASEVDFDESPVNRSEMIKRVLFLLFNVDEIPTYKARPDLKDCEYVIGYFCESMLKTRTYAFSRTHFLNVLQQCCRERFIDLEVQVVFDVLAANNILVSRDGQFCFRFAFWIYYFAALRMHHEPAFAEYMLTEQRYVLHPELVEFYTGIDRRREDAIIVLTKDLGQLRESVRVKCGLPDNMDVYKLAQWNTSEDVREQMEAEIQSGIEGSNLPAEIKDRYADQTYDPARPYSQGMNLLEDGSLNKMISALQGASRVLRNSDYVEPEAKRALLREIVSTWEQLTMVLLVVLPVLANNGHAAFDGTTFALDGNFGDTPQVRLMSILIEIPSNVVRWSKDDLYSLRMGPLLLDSFNNETNHLRKHELALFLAIQRPRGWQQALQSYIAAVAKNSFYLLDVYRALRAQYQYSYATSGALKEIEHLIRMAITKHVTGHKQPGPKLIGQMIPKLKSDSPIIPTREVDDGKSQ